MKTNFERRTWWLAGAVVAGILLALTFTSPLARANLLDSLLRNFTPFAPPESTPAATTAPAENAAEPPLYRPVLEYERAVVSAVKKASPAVVAIAISKNVPILERCSVPGLTPELREFLGDLPQFSLPCEEGSRLEEVGGGSGFTVSADGLILTNKHVVSDPNAAYTVFTSDGRKFNARVVARDPLQDLAIIKVEGSDWPTVEVGDSDTLELGQSAIAIGNALGEFRNTVSVGVISGLARTVTAEGQGVSETLAGLIQTDAAINPGNSGGPLLNLRGQVIGINTAIVSGAQSIGFAIPVNRALRDIESVKRTGEIETPFLGVRYVMLNPSRAAAEELPVDYGVWLVAGGEGEPAVTANSPAAAADLRAGDIILEMDGQRLDAQNPLAGVIARHKAGDRVSLRVLRREEELAKTVTLTRRP